ncbi:response regulator [uncultured Thiodictyon sp.]|uniref:EAL domain-containing response regulator n=1 Tax=uncultured Thiodictyon sp. TaxID=1846217 RepID=UPI0025F2FADD|nr:response regulator [uncultured Thiodictyon sp.]
MNAHNPPGSRRGTVLVLGTDAALSVALAPALASYGLDLERVQSAVELHRQVQPPDAVLALIDLRALPNTEALAGLGATGSAHPGPHLPLVGLGLPGDLPQRVAALRAGAAAWLAADLDPSVMAARLAALVGPADGTPERILVVDDQPVSALFAARVLERAGMVTQRAADPLLVLSIMDDFAPDLVLMDLHMPGISGTELTQVIREQERFADLPIVFLSVELDPERQLDALRIGGDDFLAKPVPPERLVACVRGRLARVRQRASMHRAAAPGVAPEVRERERLLGRLDRLIRSPAGADWALLYLEQPGPAAALHRLATAVRTHAGADGLTALLGEHGVCMLVRGDAARPFGVLAEALSQRLRADLQAGAGGAEVPPFGTGWCTLTAGGGESVTLVSRARKAACVSLQVHQGRAAGYVPVPAWPDAAAAVPAPVLEAIAADRFELLFQPMMPLHAAAAERYEATPRLVGPHGELLGPSVFAPVALHTGRTPHIDRELLTAGLDALRERHAAGRPINLFLPQAMASAADDAWIGWLRDDISARDLIQCRPTIQWELTDVECHLDLAARRAEQLEHLRIPLCLNGCVAGERTERALERLPVAYIRVAREPIRELSAEGLQELVGRVHGHQALVIATGVEGPEAITPLYGAGIDLIQGPYVQPPTQTMDFDFADAVG